MSAPRAIWAWTAPPPEGRLRQVWVDATGHPLEVEVSLQRTSTPTIDEVMLAELLARCR